GRHARLWLRHGRTYFEAMKAIRTTAAIATVFGILVAAALAARAADRNGRQVRQAKKVLRAITLVDGPGSGLDADSVQGLTPPMVRDANGTFVGGLVSLTDDNDGAGWVVRRIGDRPFLFHVSSAGLS